MGGGCSAEPAAHGPGRLLEPHGPRAPGMDVAITALVVRRASGGSVEQQPRPTGVQDVAVRALQDGARSAPMRPPARPRACLTCSMSATDGKRGMGDVAKLAAGVVAANAERLVQVGKDSEVQKAAAELARAVRKAWTPPSKPAP